MSSLPPIAVRLEKLRFLAEELQLAFAISIAAPDPWEGRTIARHVLLRAADVVAHSDALRRPPRPFPLDPAFKDLKETYAGWFREYFATARNRLGAHIQDLDFGLRLELWNDIEISKASVFVDGARQIYGHFEGQGLAGYVPFAGAPELEDPGFQAALERLASGGVRDGRVEVSSDPLAMSRPDTVAMISLHRLHERAGQLNLISRWIGHERRFIQTFAAFPRLVRLFRTRLLTDVVSFADCLMTRPVPPTAPQYMKGLDHLLKDESKPSAVLEALRRDYRYDDVLQRLRPLRNTFAAHLDTDDAATLPSLVAAFDALDWAWIDEVFDRLEATFKATCREVFVLRMHLAEGETLQGALRVRETESAPYDPAKPGLAAPPLPPSPVTWTKEVYSRALGSWRYGSDNERLAAMSHLRAGFSLETGEPFVIEHRTPATLRRSFETWTLAHQAVLEALLVTDGPGISSLLELLIREQNGYPTRAAEVLLRFVEASPAVAKLAMPQICAAAGHLMVWDADRHRAFLLDQVNTAPDWSTRRAATIVLFSAFVRADWSGRVNHKRAALDYQQDFAPLIAGLTPDEELEVLLAMGSAFWESLRSSANAFEAERANIARRVQELAEGVLRRQGRVEAAPTIERLLASDDFVGVVLLLSAELSDAWASQLRELVNQGWIAPAAHDQGHRNLVVCLWRAESREAALEVATRLAQTNPLHLGDQLLRLEILTELDRDLAGVRIQAGRLRSDFILTPDETARLAALDAELTLKGA